MQISEKQIEAARDKFKELSGIQIYLPGEGTLDDFEQARYDALVAALEAALSTDAEPVAWMRPANIETLRTGSSGAYSFQVSNSNFGGWTVPVYAHAEPVKTAPAVTVKVKPLDWYELTSPREDGPAEPTGDWEATTVFGEYSVCLDQDKAISETPWCVWSPDANIGHYQSVEIAKAAAQADYEARILSALYAQVQDVAGWQPIETAPKDGSEILLFREDCGVILGRWIACSDFIVDGDPSAEFCQSEAEWEEPDWFGADFVSGFRITNDGLPTHWMPLPALPSSPAPKHGEEG